MIDFKNKYVSKNKKGSESASFDQEVAEKHKSNFNMEVPSEYFSASKQRILKKTIQRRKKARVVKISFASSIAASFLIGLFMFSTQKENNSTFAIHEVEHKILINTLFVEDDMYLEQLADAYMLEDFEILKNF